MTRISADAGAGPQIVDAPMAMPPGVRVRILRDAHAVYDVEALLPNFAPRVQITGSFAPGDSAVELDDDELLLICSPHWPRLVESLSGVLALKRQIVLLLPENNAWGYADFARSLPRWPERRGTTMVSSLEARAHLSKFGKAEVLADGTVGRVDGDTIELFKTRASRNERSFQELKARFTDEESLAVLDNLKNGTLLDLFRHFSERVFRHVQYLECGVFFPEMVILNGGIQEGFELPYYMAHTGGTARVVGVDPSGFAHLGAFAKGSVEHFSDRISVVERALWSSTGDVALPVLNGVVLSQFKGLGEFPEVVFPCDTIDNIVRTQRLSAVDLLKLDVEGAEPEVLVGARETLIAHRPQLAISVYHWPEHVWDISLSLMNTLRDYDFYLRHYSFGRWECILYGIPKLGTAPRLDRYRTAALQRCSPV